MTMRGAPTPPGSSMISPAKRAKSSSPTKGPVTRSSERSFASSPHSNLSLAQSAALSPEETPNTILNNCMNFPACCMKKERFAASPFGARGMIRARCGLREKAHTYAKSRSDVARGRWHLPGLPPAGGYVLCLQCCLQCLLSKEDGRGEREKWGASYAHVSAIRDHAQQSRIWCFGKLKLSLLYWSTTARYRKLVNWYKRMLPVQTSFFWDRPHGWCSFNFWFCQFHLPGSRKICISFGNRKVEKNRQELDQVRDPNMPGTNDLMEAGIPTIVSWDKFSDFRND